MRGIHLEKGVIPLMVFWFIIEHTMLPIFFLVVLGYFLDKKFHLDVRPYLPSSSTTTPITPRRLS